MTRFWPGSSRGLTSSGAKGRPGVSGNSQLEGRHRPLSASKPHEVWGAGCQGPPLRHKSDSSALSPGTGWDRVERL